MNDSKPYLEAFDPTIIPFQMELTELVENWDYDISTPEILCSGAYGSSKSIIVCHLVILHCLNNAGAVAFIGRRSLPDLKKTIFNEICEHLVTPSLKEGDDYRIKDTTAEITFKNGSKIISGSWADRRYKKFRSLNISMMVIEEAAENDIQDKEAFMTLKARMRRLIGRDGKPILGPAILITNPDEPDHWLYDYFIEGCKLHDTRRVLYSITTDNIFLDHVYVQQLLKDMSPLESRRFIYGEWITLQGDVIYSMYDATRNEIETDYSVNLDYPVCVTFDFNIADGKPMSCAMFQHIDDHFHFFEESVMYSARTENTMDELHSRGLLSYETTYQVFGDAAGKNKDTRSKRSDYDIIYQYLEKLDINFEKKVLPSNPPIRKRHNIVNAACLNALGDTRLTVYKPCKMLRKGMRLTKLKENSNYIEDDSKACPWQHVTTAIGYAIYAISIIGKRKSKTRKL